MRVGVQKTPNRPSCRLSEEPPCTYFVVDMFGSFVEKQRRSQVKRYEAMFPCMTSRAVHIKITHNLATDLCIQV